MAMAGDVDQYLSDLEATVPNEHCDQQAGVPPPERLTDWDLDDGMFLKFADDSQDPMSPAMVATETTGSSEDSPGRRRSRRWDTGRKRTDDSLLTGSTGAQLYSRGASQGSSSPALDGHSQRRPGASAGHSASQEEIVTRTVTESTAAATVTHSDMSEVRIRVYDTEEPKLAALNNHSSQIDLGESANATNMRRKRQKSGGGSADFAEGEDTEFLRDLTLWTDAYNESFHVKIFIKELIGQVAHSVFGILSLPFLYWLYGTKVALINRGFWNGNFFSRFVALFAVLGGLVTASIAICIFWPPKESFEVEMKLLVIGILMRNMTIAFKYSSMTTNAWKRLNEMQVKPQVVYALLIGPSWQVVPYSIMKIYSEISSVGILGTRSQRLRLMPRFVPWPQDVTDLDHLRKRVDATTKRLLLMPTGTIEGREILKGHPRRLVVRNLACKMDADVYMHTDLSSDATVKADLGKVQMPHVKPSNHRCEPTIRERQAVALEPEINKPIDQFYREHLAHDIVESNPEEHCLTITKEVNLRDQALLIHAGHGAAVHIEELFNFFLRSLLRCEKVLVPTRALKWLWRLMALAMSATPMIVRLVHTGGDLSQVSVQWLVLQGLLFIPMTFMLYVNFFFIEIGARDMWRRRALMRSCAALLTLSREWRRGCPVEVDQLPVLDMNDPRSIEAWRKLRQLCLDWGRFFYDRIQLFTKSYCVLILLVGGDLMLSLTVPHYEEKYPITATKLIIYYMMFFSVGTCIMIQVFFGSEVNDGTFNHIALLQRQRMILMADQHIHTVEGLERRETFKCNPKLERAVHQLEALCDDLEAYHNARPVKLLGLYCGYSLFSALYFLPATIVFRTATFCSAEDTAWKCTGVV